MRIRSLTEWKTKDGKKRTIRLYKAWRNLLGRVQGHNRNGAGIPQWVGIECRFTSWQHFREWSLANGFSRTANSCDRIEACGPYAPDNCRWISVGDNTRHANGTVQLNRTIEDFQRTPPTADELAEAYWVDRFYLGVV